MVKITQNTHKEMSVIWQKAIPKYSKESLAAVQCRLCTGTDHLELITNNRFDEALRHRFGVKVSPKGYVCDACKKCMELIENFSALVHASFDRSLSTESSKHTVVLADVSSRAKYIPDKPKESVPLLKSQIEIERPRKKRFQHSHIPENIVRKKAIMPCSVCGQRYPMLVSGGATTFVCSRCHKNKSKERDDAAANNQNYVHCNLKSTGRQIYPLKMSQEVKYTSATKHKTLPVQRNQWYPKRYSNPENLAKQAQGKDYRADTGIARPSRVKATQNEQIYPLKMSQEVKYSSATKHKTLPVRNQSYPKRYSNPDNLAKQTQGNEFRADSGIARPSRVEATRENAFGNKDSISALKIVRYTECMQDCSNKAKSKSFENTKST